MADQVKVELIEEIKLHVPGWGSTEIFLSKKDAKQVWLQLGKIFER
jgi:hypothetical protein